MSKPFVLSKADGSQRALSGYMFAAPGADAKKYGGSVKNLPRRVDLRPQMTPVENQGRTNSCVANAVAGAYEYLAKRHLGDDSYDVSRMFIYYNARYLGGRENVKDQGSYIGKAIQGLKDYGACSEVTWPFAEEEVNAIPPDEAYDEAAQFLVEDMELVPVDMNAWKSCLAEGYPIIFGIRLYKSFDQQRKKGLVPMPTSSEATRGEHGGHAMLAVGYSDQDRVFIVRNSWGEHWGENGYCYIPYDYLMNPKYNLGDSWRIKQLENLDFDQSTWSEDEESLLPDYDNELANMSDEHFQEMIDAMGDFPLEYRLGQLFLTAAGSDAEISDEELEGITQYMEDALEKLGSDLSAKKVLRHAVNSLGNEDLLAETVVLFNQFLSNEMLARIFIDLQEVIGVDELSEEEGAFLYHLMEIWQLSEDEEDDGEDEEEDDEYDEDEDEEYEDEEDDEEYDEDDEEYDEDEEEYEEEDEEDDEDEEEYDEEEDEK
jgi:hypothetical protein